jgi:RNA polymerase sigma factor for flagellar operon FliA
VLDAIAKVAAQRRVDDPAGTVDRLWQRYKETGDESLRERLILHYSPLVKYVAGRVGVGLPRNVESGDCISFGIFGLIDAIEKFEPGRGSAFEPYAIRRIRGAIIDELRALDWIPRSVRAKARAVEQAYAAAEIAAEMGVSHSELQNNFRQLAALNVMALDELLTGTDGGEVSLGERLADLDTPDPATVFESAETRRILAEAVDALSEREQVLVRLYYFEAFTLAEIGQVLGVTESRVCQMHAKAVIALRAALA